MTNYTLKVDNKEIQLCDSKLALKLEKIGKLKGKDVAWIRSDLKVTPSNWFSRVIWTVVAKYFTWVREFFFHVNLHTSRAVLKQLEVQINGNDKLKKLFFKAVSRFNSIAPRHAFITGDMQIIQVINTQPAKNLKDYGFNTVQQVLHFTQLYGREITSLDLSAFSFSNLENKHLEKLIQNCPKLLHLFIRGSKIDDDGLKFVKGLRYLQTLSLINCIKISNIGLFHFRDLPRLKKLCLYGGFKINYQGLQNLKGHNLEILDLTSCHEINDRALEQIKDFTHLQTLYLIGCTKVTDEGIKKLRNLTSLKHLYILGCSKITSMGLGSLNGIPTLKIYNK
jgi:hypothetical protein